MTVVEAHRLSVLESGARLVTAAMPQRASVAVTFMLGVGSRFEDRSTSGLAHFIEHMVFKGSRAYPSATAISQPIEAIGGVVNAETDRESTVFWTRVPGDRLNLAIGVLSDMLLRPLLEVEEVERERQVVIEELRMSADNPQEHVHTLFEAIAWPDHPLGWDVAGREETVRSFDRDDCLAHMARHYRPENLVVCICGAVEHEEARSLVEEALGGGRPGWEAPFALPAPPPSPPSAVRLELRPIEQANIVVGGRSASYRDAQRHAVDVLNVLLGEGMSSRLFVELRERRALVYDVHSFTVRLRDTGMLAMYLGCGAAHASEAVAAAVTELRRLAADPVGTEELDRATGYLRGRLLLGLESTSSMASFLGEQLLLTGEILSPDELMRRVDGVTGEDVAGAASALLAGGLQAALITPNGDVSAVEAALSGC